ncbi:MAG: cation transporter [Bacteroidales bacterium]|nr:cation transporter [Bacteroidales bacterium]
MHKISSHTDNHRESRNLFLTVLLNLIISLVELVGGLISNSLALVSDALHNFSDGIAVMITYFANRISRRPANQQLTFGYKRIQIIAALFNALSLIAICIFLLIEAWKRFWHPEPIQGFTMLYVAIIGMIANFAGIILLRDFSKKNLNIKAAYLHLIGDTLSSVAVIVGGILVIAYELYWVDPIITAIISIYILKETWEVVSETYHILMQAGPKNNDIKALAERVMQIDNIKSIHHIHAWQLTDNDLHFEAHIAIEHDMPLSEVQKKLDKARDIIRHEFGYTHITLQAELDRCTDQGLIPLREN